MNGGHQLGEKWAGVSTGYGIVAITLGVLKLRGVVLSFPSPLR